MMRLGAVTIHTPSSKNLGSGQKTRTRTRPEASVSYPFRWHINPLCRGFGQSAAQGRARRLKNPERVPISRFVLLPDLDAQRISIRACPCLKSETWPPGKSLRNEKSAWRPESAARQRGRISVANGVLVTYRGDPVRRTHPRRNSSRLPGNGRGNTLLNLGRRR